MVALSLLRKRQERRELDAFKGRPRPNLLEETLVLTDLLTEVADEVLETLERGETNGNGRHADT